MRNYRLILVVWLLISGGCSSAVAFTAHDALVVYNSATSMAGGSGTIADYYSEGRGVPAGNVLGFGVSASERSGDAETADY